MTCRPFGEIVLLELDRLEDGARGRLRRLVVREQGDGEGAGKEDGSERGEFHERANEKTRSGGSGAVGVSRGSRAWGLDL